MRISLKGLIVITVFLTVEAACFGQIKDPMEFIRHELEKGNKNIVVPPGVYKVKPKGDAYLKLRKLNGINIVFDRVKVIGSVNTRMLDIEDCNNLTLSGLTIDYDPLPFTQAEIVSVDEQRNWIVKVIPGYPTKGIVTRGDTRVQVYSRENGELINPLRHTGNLQIEMTGNDTFRILGGGNRTGEKGDIVIVNCSNRPSEPICFVIESRRCKNLKFENFTLYSGTMAFVEHGNTRSVYKNCVIDRCPPQADYMKRGWKRLRSLNADAFHCKDDPVGPQIINCTAKYQADDCVNISGMYSMVTACSADVLRVVSVYDSTQIESGDTVQIMTIDGEKVPDAKVLSVVSAGRITPDESAFIGQQWLNAPYRNPASSLMKRVWKVTLDRKITLPKGSVIISNSSMGNGFAIKGCNFGFIRSRPILIKASNGEISGNTITASWGEAAVKVAPEYLWMEGGCSCNLKIIGNRIVNNKGYAVWVYGQPGKQRNLPADAHRDIIINNNIISGSSRGIQVVGCTGLVLKNNQLTLRSHDVNSAIALTNVENVQKLNNKVVLKPLDFSRIDFKPVLEAVFINGKMLYKSGTENNRVIDIDGSQPSKIKYVFSNCGTSPSEYNASVFVHFDINGGGTVLGGDYTPGVITSKWNKDKKVIDSREVNFGASKGKIFKMYVGMYYANDGGDRIKLGNKEQTNGLRIFVGSLNIK